MQAAAHATARPATHGGHGLAASVSATCLLALASFAWLPAVAQEAPGTAVAAGASAAAAMALPMHGQRMLPINGRATRVAVSDPNVADVQILSGSGSRAGGVMLFANQPGTADVQVWTSASKTPRHWRVTVLGDDRPSAAAASQAPGSMVQVEVKVVEVSRNALKDVGVRWSSHDGGPWSASLSLIPAGLSGMANGGFSLFYTSGDFDAGLSLLESTGMGRILAEPTLVAMSGQSASFLAGGEIPVPQSGGLGTTTVEYKPFGIGLTVSPTVLSRDRIALKVAPEASELDYGNAIPISNGDQVTLMPALRTRRADTMIELGDGESFVISGLVSRQTIANVSKVPFLGDLPIIGAFFRSVAYSQEEHELIIVVTPHLVKPIARGAHIPLPGDKLEKRNTPGNAWGYYLMGPAGGQQMPGFSR
ncbi:type II and III secretion system protein family protein [Allopusillimonas soli]|uniref:Pilus assembly protein N-terminal domain-containing protein n=1 Tax=Allopusillimonas soli TaxID=659016 RepID=A0A853FGI1_9BURK|nr:pilus assembly protein N-terminal domain-containing protein [Allopusillimonas soli]TEA70284.1 type II and III secretion system protein family protein [Allopusillimonas soli]